MPPNPLAGGPESRETSRVRVSEIGSGQLSCDPAALPTHPIEACRKEHARRFAGWNLLRIKRSREKQTDKGHAVALVTPFDGRQQEQAEAEAINREERRMDVVRNQ